MEIVSLACPNCKAPLRIAPEADTFQCGFCGTRLSVNRGGGGVSLSRVEASLGRIEGGLGVIGSNTSRAASELALSRLKGEHAEVKKRLADLKPPTGRTVTLICLFGFVFLLLAFACSGSTGANTSLAKDMLTFNIFCGGGSLLGVLFFGYRYRQIGQQRSAYDQTKGELTAKLKQIEDEGQYHRRNAQYNQ